MLFRSGTSALDPSSPRSVGSFQAEAYLSHNHGVTDPGHFHDAGIRGQQNVNAGGSAYQGALGTTSVSTTGITINSSGGAETRPDNYAVLMCIKT